jgi:hypothetical protein
MIEVAHATFNEDADPPIVNLKKDPVLEDIVSGSYKSTE